MRTTVIPLECWQDPESDIVMTFSQSECSVFFGCLAAPDEPADHIACLSFERAVAVRSVTRSIVPPFFPYRIPKHQHRSFILRMTGSDMQREYRQRHDPAWQRFSLRFQHF